MFHSKNNTSVSLNDFKSSVGEDSPIESVTQTQGSQRQRAAKVNFVKIHSWTHTEVLAVLTPVPRPSKKVQHNSVPVVYLLCSQETHGQREKVTSMGYLLY